MSSNNSPLQEKYNRFSMISNNSILDLSKSILSHQSVISENIPKNDLSMQTLSFISDNEDDESFTSPSFTKYSTKQNKSIITDFESSRFNDISIHSTTVIEDDIEKYVSLLNELDEREAAAIGILTTPIDDLTLMEEYVISCENSLQQYERLLKDDQNQIIEDRLNTLNKTINTISNTNKMHKKRLKLATINHLIQICEESLKQDCNDYNYMLSILQERIETLENINSMQKLISSEMNYLTKLKSIAIK